MAASGAGPVVLVTRAAAASGSRAAAAALACAASRSDRAALLVDLGAAPARPTLLATAGARALEERLAAHLPDAAIASRGCLCHLALPVDGEGVEAAAMALPLVRESAGVLHLPPRLLRPVLAETRIAPTAALLRADLPADRALTALAVRDLMERRLRVAVLKRQLGWLAARAALLGALPPGGPGLADRLVGRLLEGAEAP